MRRFATDKPFHKTAAGKKQQRRLAAFASVVESEAQLDIILNNDLKLRGNPILKAEVKQQIMALNPKIAEASTGV